MLLLSLGVHLVVVAALLLAGQDRFRRDMRPVYRVDLVSPPVASPQAGRPDAGPPPAAPIPKPQPARPEPVKITKPEAAKPAAVVKKAEPAKKPAEPQPKPKSPKAQDEESLEQSLREMQERAALDRTLAAMRQKTTGKEAAGAAPVGMPEGKGSEAGSSYDLWLRTQLREQWSYSPYLGGGRTDLEALFLLRFDARGTFVDYRIVRSSGNRQFDESIVRALLKLFKAQGLPSPPKRATEFEVAFNLKELKR
jgi:outer membrane biosynthesis protein TonB